MVKDNKGRRFVIKEDGTTEERKAGPRLLSKALRELPGEYVTTEHADDQKAHPLDPPHIVRDVARSLAFEEASGGIDEAEFVDRQNTERRNANDPLFKLTEAAKRRQRQNMRARVTQADVDIVRMQVLRNMVKTADQAIKNSKKPKLDVVHVWYPEDRIGRYELRTGNPPARSQRPRHLRDIELWVDPFNLPKTILAALSSAGVTNVKAIQDKLQLARHAYLTGKAGYETAIIQQSPD